MKQTAIIGEASGDSYKQVQRFIRLTNSGNKERPGIIAGLQDV